MTCGLWSSSGAHVFERVAVALALALTGRLLALLNWEMLNWDKHWPRWTAALAMVQRPAKRFGEPVMRQLCVHRGNSVQNFNSHSGNTRHSRAACVQASACPRTRSINPEACPIWSCVRVRASLEARARQIPTIALVHWPRTVLKFGNVFNASNG